MNDADRAVLDAVARAVDAGAGIEAARARLRAIDPLLRTAAERRLRGAFADAQVMTELRGGREAERHALRITYLLVAGVVPEREARDDEAVVQAKFDQVRSLYAFPGRPVWWRTLLSAFGVAVVVAVGVGFARRTPSAEPTSVAEPLPDAGVAKAVRVEDPVLARSFGADLPAFLVALDKRATARREGRDADVQEAEKQMAAARASALAPDAKTSLGGAAAAAFEALFDAAELAAAASHVRGEALSEAAGKLDQALDAAGLGYAVDADLLLEDSGRRLVLIYSFHVESEALFRSQGREVRALLVRRLDKLNWTHTLLGFSRAGLPDAFVLLDQLDDHLLRILGPALADGARMELFDPDAPAADRGAVEARAGELARAEIAASRAIDAPALAKLGKLLGERGAIFARMDKFARASDTTITAPSTLRLPEGFEAGVRRWVQAADLKALLEVDQKLGDPTLAAAFAGLRELIVPSIERHEVQHRLDALGPERPSPPILLTRTGPLTGPDGAPRRIATLARDELSAYLAQLAREQRMPGVVLAMIGRLLFDERFHGTAECYAALAIFESLAPVVLADKPPVLVVKNHVDRRAAATVWLALAALPPDKLRAEAAALWQRLFGAPLAEITGGPSPDLHR